MAQEKMTKSEKIRREENEMRNTLFYLSGKMMLKDDSVLKDLLRMYFKDAVDGAFRKYERLDLMLENMRKQWLVDISINDKYVMVVKDISITNDWWKEKNALNYIREARAFGVPKPNSQAMKEYSPDWEDKVKEEWKDDMTELLEYMALHKDEYPNWKLKGD